jgi:hypothetical protein
VIGASAGTATWSGWVGLGTLTGFGVVHPLPGIWDGLTLNTAITLPVGVEAYAVYALSVATDARPLSERARRYAWGSAAAALLLGMGGQIAYHLVDAAGAARAPWWVVALVSCLPVVVLGAASLLWHLAGDPVPEAVRAEASALPPLDVPVPDALPEAAPDAVPVDPAPVRLPLAAPPAEYTSAAPAPGTPAVADPANEPRAADVPEPQPEYSPPARFVPTAAVTSAVPATAAASAGPHRAVATVSVPPAADVAPRTTTSAAASDDQSAGDVAIVADLVAAGRVPSIRALKTTYRLGQDRAARIRAQVATQLDTAEQPTQSRHRDRNENEDKNKEQEGQQETPDERTESQQQPPEQDSEPHETDSQRTEVEHQIRGKPENDEELHTLASLIE